jgi:microcystin-dependent protein
MANPFLGEILMFAGNFAPRNYATCDGQLLSIAQNTALFSLLGTSYGGNGTTNFSLPDYRGRVPINMGQGNGLSPYTIGEVVGTETVTLLSAEMPIHNHGASVTNAAANSSTPGAHLPATLSSPWTGYWVQNANKTGSPIAISPTALEPRGGSQAHENRMPVMAINFVIALAGIFPSRN